MSNSNNNIGNNNKCGNGDDDDDVSVIPAKDLNDGAILLEE